MRGSYIRRPGRFLASGLLLISVALASTSGTSAAQAQAQGSLEITPGDGAIGSTFHVHGTGFRNFSLVTNTLNLSVFDASNTMVDRGSVDATDDGTIDATIDTSDGQYTSGTYSVLASYTYWGVRRDPVTNVILCDFCPTKTVPLAEPVTFTLQ